MLLRRKRLSGRRVGGGVGTRRRSRRPRVESSHQAPGRNWLTWEAGSRRHFFFFQAEDGIRDVAVTGVQTCALPILMLSLPRPWMAAHVLRAITATPPNG